MGCIIVLISKYDLLLETFMSYSDEFNVKVLVPENLSKAGWYYDDSDRQNSSIVIGSDRILEKDIIGVITRLSAVTVDELPHIQEPDRLYAAAEMNAFLLAWLSSLKCPVINRPTDNCLCGPNLSSEQWVYSVANMGIPVVPSSLGVYFNDKNKSSQLENDFSSSESFSVTVIGDHCLGNMHQGLLDSSRNIARFFSIDFLQVNYSHKDKDARFVSAYIWPEITPKIAKLLLECVVTQSSKYKRKSISLCH